MRILDAHSDTLYELVTRPGKANDISLERLRQGGVSLQTLAMYVGPKAPLEEVEILFSRMLDAFEQLKAEGWVQAWDPSEAVDGEVRAMLSIEGCEVFARGLETIGEYRSRGVRMAAVTWNHENALATPHCVNAVDGLKPYGLAAVREMQRQKIAVDVSHLNEAGFWDILKGTDVPPMASHSCCRALKDHTRNLTDEQLRALFTAGGFVGLNFYPAFLSSGPCTLDTLVDHFDRMMTLGGEGKIGFGSDFDGIETKPESLDNPLDYPKLLAALRRRGYGEADVRSIAGEAMIDYFARI
ncbi:MAG: dipeptidase [Christensenellales bacterium]